MFVFLNDMSRKIDASQQNDLDELLRYSLFRTEAELEEQLESLSQYKTGTRIVIYNLFK